MLTHIRNLILALSTLASLSSCKQNSLDPSDAIAVGDSVVIANHTTTHLSAIPEQWILKAKSDLHIAYGHTSHGSQLITGMDGLVATKGTLYSFNSDGSGGALELHDTPFSGAYDLGNPDWTAWEPSTHAYLNAHPEINVVIWSWCGEVSGATAADITRYLTLMNGLEHDYPKVKFVYMTGHLDGTGVMGNLYQRDEQIRAYVRANNKILYDFADIESYNPDGASFVEKNANDACDYDSDGNGSLDRNWATDWQTAHPGQWYNCDAAHSQPLNGNLKAYAAWYLWAGLAGWDGK